MRPLNRLLGSLFNIIIGVVRLAHFQISRGGSAKCPIQPASSVALGHESRVVGILLASNLASLVLGHWPACVFVSLPVQVWLYLSRFANAPPSSGSQQFPSGWLVPVKFSLPNPACARLVGCAPLKRDDSVLEYLPYNQHCPRPPTSGYPGKGRLRIHYSL